MLCLRIFFVLFIEKPIYHCTLPLKGLGQVTIHKPVISVPIVFCTDLGGWGKSTLKLLLKIHHYLCNRTKYECLSFVSLRSVRVHLQNNTFILKKAMENNGYMAYQKYCKIVVSKEVCLPYVTLPLGNRHS